MKKVTVTFSIPENLNHQLHSVVEKRGLSQFVSKAIEQALQAEEAALKQAYKEASGDPERNSLIDDWSSLDGAVWDD